MTNTKVRRSGRISREIPIILIGSDAEGLVFSEETKTVVLSRHGAGIVSVHKLIAEQELHIRSLEFNRETEIRVVGEIGTEGCTHTYGVAFTDPTDPTIDFWQIEFPPPPSANGSPTLSLACSGCGQDLALEQGDYEADVCAIHGGLVRYCVECGLSTCHHPDCRAFLARVSRSLGNFRTRKGDLRPSCCVAECLSLWGSLLARRQPLNSVLPNHDCWRTSRGYALQPAPRNLRQ